MPKTQVSCPNCRQPVVADVDQLFDMNVDPSAKQRLLSGAYNLIQCPTCGYQGNLATPIVYHDPEKELLLTFVPPELGIPADERERAIGSMINQVMNKLPQEKRKGYLLRPQETLTMQGLVERILEGDGVTREMLKAQQQRLNLIQRLANASDDEVIAEIIKQEEDLVDADFFGLLNNLVQAAAVSGDENSARMLADLQQRLLPMTDYGRELQEQSKEVEAAITDLRALGKDLTREKMLELVLQAPNDTRVQALVGLARPVMDYAFFQLLSERIDRSRGEGRTRMVELRSKLLEMTEEVDRQVEARNQQAQQQVNSILQADDITEAMMQNLGVIDDFFIQELVRQQEQARAQGDLEKSAKVQEALDIIQQASSPPGFELVQEYLDSPDETARAQFLDEHQEEITQEFMDMLANITNQVQSSGEEQLIEHVMAANRQALRFSMQRSMGA
jgi:hypothetical protein